MYCVQKLSGLNPGPKLKFKIQHLLINLDSDIKIIIDAHSNENTINILRKDYKMQMAQYDIDGNFPNSRGILVLTKELWFYCN